MEQGGRMLKKLVSNLLKNTMPAQSDKKHLESVELVWNKESKEEIGGQFQRTQIHQNGLGQRVLC